MQELWLICLKIPLVSPLGLMEYLTNWGRARPLYYLWVGPGAPLGRLRAALHAVAVVCTWLLLYVKQLHAAASGG